MKTPEPTKPTVEVSSVNTSWECPTCMVPNKATDDACACCTTPNPNKAGSQINGSLNAQPTLNGFKPTTFTKPATTTGMSYLLGTIYILFFSIVWVQSS